MDTPRTLGSCTVPAADLLDAFTGYLFGERSLAGTTVENYLNQVRPFITWCSGPGRVELAVLTIGDVNRFLAWRAGTCSAGSLKVATTALRALLRWMFLDARLDHAVAEGIGPVRYLPWASGPKALSAADLAALLAVEMSTRDRALVLLLARLGLRSREVAELHLGDLDWRAGTIRVTGKGDDHQLMPLPGEVGEALAAYLHGDRRQSSVDRHVFLTAAPAGRPLDRSGVSGVVTRLAKRAGINGRVGAHRLRHSAATAVLAGGGTLAEAGQLLRHRSVASTAIYAKVDDAALRQLVRAWPTAAVR